MTKEVGKKKMLPTYLLRLWIFTTPSLFMLSSIHFRQLASFAQFNYFLILPSSLRIVTTVNGKCCIKYYLILRHFCLLIYYQLQISFCQGRKTICLFYVENGFSNKISQTQSKSFSVQSLDKKRDLYYNKSCKNPAQKSVEIGSFLWTTEW